MNKWQEGQYKAVMLRSPMGSGKSTLLQALLAEEPEPETVNMASYRRTQALDAQGKHKDFSHYEVLKQADGREVGGRFIRPLAHRELHPRVICQVDSLPGLLAEDDEDAPAFDLLVLDESESILAHLSANTLRERHTVIRLLVRMMSRAQRIICMDGHLGQRTFEFLTMHGISCSPVVVNTHPPERPLQVEFVHGKNKGLPKWEGAIFEALEAGRNVFVVSMSSDKARELGAMVADRAVVENDQILIITRHSDGAVKRGLQDVNVQWRKRLVIISPTVEAGVDFNQRWFHQMFLYICPKSTHPRGLDQMKGRVRKLEDQRVLCYVQEGIRLPAEGSLGDSFLTKMKTDSGSIARLGLEETYQWFLNQDQRGGLGVNCAGPITRLLAHNEKELSNGQTHFYEEFTDLLRSDGHIVLGVPVEESDDGEAVEVNPGGSEEGGRRGKYLLEAMIRAPNISQAQFADIEARVRKNQDHEGEIISMEKYQLARFYDVPHLNEDFLRTVGPYPIHAVDFLEQVVDEGYKHEEAEIGRHRYPPLMADMARELLRVLGFGHPLDLAHKTAPLEALRPQLAGTAFFQNYSENARLFHTRATGAADALAYQKSATIGLNHVFSALGLRLKARNLGKLEVNDGKSSTGKQRRRKIRYGGWYLSRNPRSTTRPVCGPPGVDVMAQLLKLRLEHSDALKARIPATLRDYVDGLRLAWPELVQDRRCEIEVGPREVE
ncbi:hypothetical protein KFL_007110030 [Klebsormidium nitens]|uniref:Replication origin-binding protein domain-containing protein n=1 Tax=Klebsormidium nitens TaxID=105231 RepID=A0A1Y1IP84_KLENI|nr:hypothetical protein KFL_007110030 [Klebsormidium nitens]|eukprot:GAQ90991.1 hypothetical protein KFL_007110030 [Klebsormidium nitens]